MSSGGGKKTMPCKMPVPFQMSVCGHKWLTAHTFEIRFHRPSDFNFLPGQKVQVIHDGVKRDYSLLSTAQDDELAICVRHIPEGRMSPVLAHAPVGRIFHLTPAFGFFLFQPSRRPAVFVATGTGIAPFVAFVRSGVRGFHLLHGVRCAEELYYHDLLAPAASSFIPCLTGTRPPAPHRPHAFAGRVTAYLENRLIAGDYDFYLCGRGEMVRDALRIIDRRFPSARVFTETFF
jgi:benzoate/toluate 1,2-dioxygenase reductase subunit